MTPKLYCGAEQIIERNGQDKVESQLNGGKPELAI